MDLTHGSDNVFEDLGLPNPEERLAKAQLARRMSTLVEESVMSSRGAMSQTGLTETKLDDPLCGRLREFSLGDLFRILNALRQDVEIIIRERDAGDRQGRLAVITAWHTLLRLKPGLFTNGPPIEIGGCMIRCPLRGQRTPCPGGTS